MFTLLLKNDYGWTDSLGHCEDRSLNQWPTEEDALAAAAELDQIWGTTSVWRVVSTDDLKHYDLIA